MCVVLEASDNLWPLLGESSISKPSELADNINDVLDPSVFLAQEHSALVESRNNIDEGLQENGLSFHKDDNLSTILDVSNNPWPLPQESNIDHDTNCALDSSMLLDQELPVLLADTSTEKVKSGKGLNSKRTRERNHGLKRIQPRKKVVEPNAEEGSASKKQDHNAKERVRRKNLNSSYLALGSLLPDSQRSKVESQPQCTLC